MPEPTQDIDKLAQQIFWQLYKIDISKYSPQEKQALIQQEYYKYQLLYCKENPSYFINTYVKIEDRDVEGIVIPFKLWKEQEEVLNLFQKERLIQLLKANQLGLTWEAISYGLWKMIFSPGYSVKCISDTETKAVEIARRMEFILKHLPSWFMTNEKNNAGIPWFEATKTSITIHHPPKEKIDQEDSTAQAFPSSPTAAASFTANLFIIDEWALQQFAELIWGYIFPTINRPTGGQVIGLSTIERGSFFEKKWHEKNNFKKIFLPWTVDPRRDAKWYENTIVDYGLDYTRQHYPATEEEAFSIPGGAYFDKFNPTIHVKDPLIAIPEWYSRYRFMDYGMDMLACYFCYIDGYGHTRIYKEIYESGLIISAACYRILQEAGARVPDSAEKWEALTSTQKREIALTATERFVCTYAPPDLFAKSNQTGKSSDQVFYENGIPLTKVKNDFEQGCLAVTQWLQPFLAKDEQTGVEYYSARLTIDKDRLDPKISCAPNLTYALLNVQKDKLRTEVYSKIPHSLSHAPDALRYYCSEVVAVPINQDEVERQRRQELYNTPYPKSRLEREEISDPDLIF